ncbi:hypothetical protein BDB00DRAFT_799866 [Zychaea mexicana]|uniref:uncharacterized protein n=1 Tax=Zychaea mexicana TaxID=64656 RepID=UPI0022FDC9DA|nr:uncharacterized protein BDB00DRAFT_799866 [Zychaea mexicana]KAI9498333.1 hypothetical protein BDB00DRAFT_799866 [Zychaea mexicana]
MHSLQQLIIRGYTLSSNVGEAWTTPRDEPPEQAAQHMMSQYEREAYTTWRNGRRPDALNLEQHVVSADTCGRSQASIDDRVEAARVIFDNPNITVEHVLYIERHRNYLLPLITAQQRVRAAQRAATGGHNNYPPLHHREYQLIRRALTISGHVRTTNNTRIRNLNRTISEAENALRNRLAQVAPPNTRRSEAHVTNRSLAPIPTPLDVTRITSGARYHREVRKRPRSPE